MSLSAQELKEMIDRFDADERPNEHGAQSLHTALSAYLKGKQALSMRYMQAEGERFTNLFNKHRITR